MVKKFILIIFLLFSAVPLFGQTQIDSLQKELKASDDTTAIKIQNKIALKFSGKPDSALFYAEKALKGARTYDMPKEEALALTSIGFAYSNKGDYIKGLDYNQQSLKIYERIGDNYGIAGCLIRIGIVHYYQKNYDESLKYYLEAKDISEEIGDKKGVASCLTNIGIIYDIQKQYGKAIEYFNNSLKISEERGEKSSIAIALINIGYVLNEDKQYRDAITYLNRGLQLVRELDDIKAVTVCLLNIADSYYYLKDYATSIEYAQLSLAMAESFHSKDDMQVAYKSLSDSYTAQKKYKDALSMHILYKTMSDSIFNETNIRQIHELEQKYQSAKKERENELLRKDQEIKEARIKIQETSIKKQKMYTVVISCGLGLVLFFSIVLFRANIQKKRINIILETQKKEIQSKSQDLQTANEKLQKLNEELSKALQEVKTLSGMVPICSYCKKIRDDKGYWEQLEEYILNHSEATFSHGICPECYEKVKKQMDKYNPGKSST